MVGFSIIGLIRHFVARGFLHVLATLLSLESHLIEIDDCVGSFDCKEFDFLDFGVIVFILGLAHCSISCDETPESSVVCGMIHNSQREIL